MRKAKWIVLMIFAIASLTLSFAAAQKSASRKNASAVPGAFRDNNCVTCHAKLTEPVSVSAHFYEWRNSKHEKSGVSCEQCHGGDPQIKNLPAAHEGVLRAAFPQSRLHPQQVAETCSACHTEVVNAFVKSQHFQKLRTDQTGPSCTTCHKHMATSVITWPPDTTNLCAKCHNHNGGAASQHLKVPAEAGATIAAFSRAEGVLEWAQTLIAEGKQKKLSFKAEETQLKQLARKLKDAKTKWHAFNLPESRRQVDEVFLQTTEIKDRIWQRLPE